MAKASATRWPVERAEDGTYYREEEGERVQIIGGRTLLETRLEYVIADCVRKYGHVGQMCRMIALFCLHSDFQRREARYPETIRVTLPEDSYLQWGWYHLNPIWSPRIPWRPPDRHSDPESLAIDVVARYSERNPLPLPERAPEEAEVHREFTRQYEQAIDTDLRLGDKDEALLVYRGRQVRWINGTRAFCPVLIVGVRDDESAEERQFVSEFLSVVCFETSIPLVSVTSVIFQRKVAPTIMQPRKLADHVYPADLRLDIGRPLGPRRLEAQQMAVEFHIAHGTSPPGKIELEPSLHHPATHGKAG